MASDYVKTLRLLSWLPAGFASLSTVLRLWVMMKVMRQGGLDDYLMCLALVRTL